MICLRHTLSFKHLLIWQTNSLKQKIRKNSEFVEEIKNRWSNFKDETEKMSKKEIKNEKPNDILGIINEILDFDKEIQNQQVQV